MSTNTIPIGGGNNRIGYIDAMRGFSMILVVLGHVLLVMGFPTDSTVLGSILLTFRMPLFFFVSGFFAYRALEKWTLQFCRSVLKRKIQAQIICTIFFYTLFQFCHDRNPLIALQEGFSWFWFTIVLFQMFVIYMMFASAEHITKKRNIVTPSLIFLSALFFLIFVKSNEINFRVWRVLQWGYLAEYFQFFTFGILCRKYYPLLNKCLNSDSFRTTAILTYIISLMAVYGFNRHLQDLNSSIYNIMSMVVVRYTGLLTIFIMFFSNGKYFSNDDRPCRWLRFVGRRTLDIYMLHVFLLPNLLFLQQYLSGNGMLLNQLTIGLIGAILNIAVCLFISNLLRSSNFLSRWLFGEKGKQNTNLSTSTLIP